MFVRRQFEQIHREGAPALYRKMRKAAWWAIVGIPALLAVLALRLIRPLVLVRFYAMTSDHIGHFAGDTEHYLCERDAGINVPSRRHLDVCFMGERPVCNEQLASMWRRVLHVWPAWMLAPIVALSRRIPGGEEHHIEIALYDHDVRNLLDRFPQHLRFTADEEARGQAGLRAMGITPGTPYVCVTARDNAYFQAHWPDHNLGEDNYRNCDIENFVLAAEELARRGYVVIRMGAKVQQVMRTPRPMILDYATNGMRTDFMDVYLGATCAFCISSSTGFDAIPRVFRRPVSFVNMVQWVGIAAASSTFLAITKHHYSISEKRELTLKEVLALGHRFFEVNGNTEATGIRLIENTPEEIRDIAVEMAERLRQVWRPEADDESLQRHFWAQFPAAGDHEIRGEIRGRFGAAFLRSNRAWLG